MSDEFAWMFHAETGNYWQCPVGAIQYWTPRGWVPSDPPPVVDPTKVHEPEGPAPATPDPIQAQATAPEPKSAKSGKAGSTEGAE